VPKVHASRRIDPVAIRIRPPVGDAVRHSVQRWRIGLADEARYSAHGLVTVSAAILIDHAWAGGR